jgi:polyisoprenoid-binding protein YceI
VASTRAADTEAIGLSPGDWRVVRARSELGFLTQTLFGLITVRGRYSGFDGWLHIDSAGRARGGLRIEAGTVRTRISKRDAHLRSTDFFAVERYPHMTFELKALTPSRAGAATVIGILRIRDRAVPIVTPVSVAAVGADGVRIDADFEVDPRGAGFYSRRLPHTVRIQAALVLEPTR